MTRSRLEKLSDRYLRVGRHPFRVCKKERQEEDGQDTQVCGCCHTDSPIYSKLWPLIFFISALTDFPMPLPKGKKPGQHRDWGYIPVIIVSGFAAFIYYGYLSRIVLVLLWDLNRKSQAIGYLVPFNLFFLFFMISYARVVSQKPGQPKVIQINDISIKNKSLENDSSIVLVEEEVRSSREKPDSILGEPKWCGICKNWKPDRTHHCRVCDACVLRMDHHCPWVNGCVGVLNYRFYIQFLCYVSLLATWIFSTSLGAFIEFHGLSYFDNVALAVIILTGIVTLLIGSFTLSHIWLVLLNRTTIENSKFQSWNKARRSGNTDKLIQAFTENGNNVFNQGYQRNWTEVMGTKKLLWFLPLRSREDLEKDGIHYGYNETILQEYRNEDQSRR